MACQDPARCVSAGLLYISPTQINAFVPTAVTSITVTVNSISVSKSVSPSVLAPSLAPGVFLDGFDCSFDPAAKDPSPCGLSSTQHFALQPIRGAVTDQAGHLVLSSNPARIGPTYTLWLTGLGAVQGTTPSAPAMLLSNIPQYGTATLNWEPIKQPVAAHSPQFPGLDQINFQLPSDLMGSSLTYPPFLFPCGTYKMELTLSFSDIRSTYYGGPNTIQIPVLVQSGDVPCAK